MEVNREKSLQTGPTAVGREFSASSEGSGKIPIGLWFGAGALVCMASFYFGVYHGGFRSDVFDEAESSPRLFSREHGTSTGSASKDSAPSLAQEGKSVYSYCVPCHQGSGLGIANQFPPLVGASWVVGSEKRLIAILLKGLAGPLDVAGANYNGLMPAWETQLSDRKIAAVASYIRSSWGNSASEISEGKVRSLRKILSDRTASWTQSELLAIPESEGLAESENPKGDASANSVGGVSGGSGEAVSKVDLDAGKASYGAICAACHQPSGMGLPPVFPPLAGSEYVKGNSDRIISIILKGVQGALKVSGSSFNGMMPAQEAVLSDKKISEIVSYVRQAFGGVGPGDVSVEDVKRVRASLSKKSAPWTEAELLSFPEKGLPSQTE